MTTQSLDLPSVRVGVTFEQVRLAFVWLIFALSFVVIFEPAPGDLMFFLAFAAYFYSGLNITNNIMPLFGLLLLYNLGGLTSYILFGDDVKAGTFVLASTYMAISAVFFASFIARDTQKRFALIQSGYIFGATIAAAIGLLGYMNASGFGHLLNSFGASRLILLGRATGAFKDPNVYSTYLVIPTVMLIQGFLIGTHKRPRLCFISLAIISPGLFLAFSRGAWINVLMSCLIMIALTFFLTPSIAMRRRIIGSTVVGAILFSVAFAILFSVPAIRDLFLDRFTLLKNYDAGETGRFGNQLNSIPLLLNLPFGFGPLQFAHIFGNDPHNTFLNAFASYGWLGGIIYFTLTVSNIVIGLRTVFTKSPFQNHAILIFSCLLAIIFQGVQIDTEHWRHYYWLIGLMWGLFAATQNYVSTREHKYAHSEETVS